MVVHSTNYGQSHMSIGQTKWIPPLVVHSTNYGQNQMSIGQTKWIPIMDIDVPVYGVHFKRSTGFPYSDMLFVQWMSIGYRAILCPFRMSVECTKTITLWMSKKVASGLPMDIHSTHAGQRQMSIGQTKCPYELVHWMYIV